jgi:hypothetical protein
MIIFLAFIYVFSAVLYFYTNKAGYSFLRYIWKRKNINVYLSTEIFYLILTSLIVFTSNPLKLDCCNFNVSSPYWNCMACGQPK